MLTIASITLDGTPLPLDKVVADVVIRHGRSSYFDGATASTAQVTVLGATRSLVTSISLSRPLIVNYSVDGGAPLPRFTGRTTDATLDDDVLTIIAVGRLSTLDGYTIGTYAYPLESWTQRVTRAFNDAGLLGVLDMTYSSTFNPTLNSRAIDAVTLAAYLDELLQITAAVASDTPAGHILVEAAESRTGSGPTTILPGDVAYSPAWEKVLPGSNKATIGYQDVPAAPATVSATDAAAVAQYGPRPFELNPQWPELKLRADAQHIADGIVSRQASPRWSTPAATILEPLELHVGAAVKLSQLPPSSPYTIWTAIVEGWTDNVGSDGEDVVWTMELSLSDPYFSGVVVHVAWEDLPPSQTWTSTDPETSWDEADELAP